MNSNVAQYSIIGRYMSGKEVTGYQLQAGNGGSKRFSKEQVYFLVGRGRIDNCTGQVYEDKVILKGKGVNLNDLPIVNDKTGQMSNAKNGGTAKANTAQFMITKRLAQSGKVVGYVVQSANGATKKLSRQDVIAMVKEGKIGNARVQMYQGKILLRGKGINLNNLPVEEMGTPAKKAVKKEESDRKIPLGKVVDKIKKVADKVIINWANNNKYTTTITDTKYGVEIKVSDGQKKFTDFIVTLNVDGSAIDGLLLYESIVTKAYVDNGSAAIWSNGNVSKEKIDKTVKDIEKLRKEVYEQAKKAVKKEESDRKIPVGKVVDKIKKVADKVIINWANNNKYTTTITDTKYGVEVRVSDGQKKFTDFVVTLNVDGSAIDGLLLYESIVTKAYVDNGSEAIWSNGNVSKEKIDKTVKDIEKLRKEVYEQAKKATKGVNNEVKKVAEKAVAWANGKGINARSADVKQSVIVEVSDGEKTFVDYELKVSKMGARIYLQTYNPYQGGEYKPDVIEKWNGTVEQALKRVTSMLSKAKKVSEQAFIDAGFEAPVQTQSKKKEVTEDSVPNDVLEEPVQTADTALSDFDSLPVAGGALTQSDIGFDKVGGGDGFANLGTMNSMLDGFDSMDSMGAPSETPITTTPASENGFTKSADMSVVAQVDNLMKWYSAKGMKVDKQDTSEGTVKVTINNGKTEDTIITFTESKKGVEVNIWRGSGTDVSDIDHLAQLRIESNKLDGMDAKVVKKVDSLM